MFEVEDGLIHAANVIVTLADVNALKGAVPELPAAFPPTIPLVPSKS